MSHHQDISLSLSTPFCKLKNEKKLISHPPASRKQKQTKKKILFNIFLFPLKRHSHDNKTIRGKILRTNAFSSKIILWPQINQVPCKPWGPKQKRHMSQRKRPSKSVMWSAYSKFSLERHTHHRGHWGPCRTLSSIQEACPGLLLFGVVCTLRNSMLSWLFETGLWSGCGTAPAVWSWWCYLMGCRIAGLWNLAGRGRSVGWNRATPLLLPAFSSFWLARWGKLKFLKTLSQNHLFPL